MEHFSIASRARLPGRGWIFRQRLCSHRTLTCDRGDSLRGNNFCKAGLVPVASRMLQPMPESAPGWCLLFSPAQEPVSLGPDYTSFLSRRMVWSKNDQTDSRVPLVQGSGPGELLDVLAYSTGC